MTADNRWKNEPEWLTKKRQLANTLQKTFRQYPHQEKWLPWQDMGTDQANWLSMIGDFVALPLSVAVDQYSDLLQENLMEKGINWQDNQLFAAHLANLDGGQFIYVTADRQVSTPIEFAGQGMLTNPHNVIIVGANSKVTIKEKLQLKSAQPMFAGTELLVGPGAQVDYEQVNELRAPAIFTAVHAYQARGARLNTRLVVENEGDLTLSLYDFLDGDESTWNGEIYLQPGRTGIHDFIPSVDGFGTGTSAHLTTYVDQNKGGQVQVGKFQPASGEPLSVENQVEMTAGKPFKD